MFDHLVLHLFVCVCVCTRACMCILLMKSVECCCFLAVFSCLCMGDFFFFLSEFSFFF